MFQVHGGMKEDTIMELMMDRASTSPSGTLRSGATTTARWSRPPWTGTTGSGRRIRYGCASDNTITKVGRITVNYFSTPFRTTSGPRSPKSLMTFTTSPEVQFGKRGNGVARDTLMIFSEELRISILYPVKCVTDTLGSDSLSSLQNYSLIAIPREMPLLRNFPFLRLRGHGVFHSSLCFA